MSKQRRIQHFFPLAGREGDPDTEELPHKTSSNSVGKKVKPDVAEEIATTPLERFKLLKPLAGKRPMQVQQQYALDDDHQLVVAVPLGQFASLVYAHELIIPNDKDAFAMTRRLELDDLAGPLMVDPLVMLERIKKHVPNIGSISHASNTFEVRRRIGKTRVSVKLSSTTQAGTMLAALAWDELAKLDEDALVAWQDRWSKVVKALSEWQGKPIEPTPIEPPTTFPIVLAPHFPADLVVQLALGHDGTAGQLISDAQRAAMVCEINARAQGYLMSISGCAISLRYLIGGRTKRLTLVRCMTTADVHVMGTASRLLRADSSCVPLVVAAVEEWRLRRVGLVDPVNQPRFAHPQMIQDSHTRERLDQAMFRDIPGIEVHCTAEASLNDLVISKDGKAQVVQLKGSSTVMRDGKAVACFNNLDKTYDVVVMSTGQLPNETRLWACVSTHKDRQHRGVNVKTLTVSLDRPESKVMKAIEGLVVFDQEVGKDGTWEDLQREMHIAIFDKVLTFATNEQYDQLAKLCKEVPASAISNITEDINIATFLRLSGFKGERGENYKQVDLSIETPEGLKRVQIKSVRADGNFWKIDFGRGTYHQNSFDFLVVVLCEEGYWMIPMDALVKSGAVHTDGRASMVGFAAHKTGNQWTAQYWTTAVRILA
jgi:hypothetical protein